MVLFLRAFGGGGVFAWSTGIVYVGYDTVLLVFVFVQTLHLMRPVPVPAPAPASQARHASLGVIVAAHNEAGILPRTLDALFAQTDPPEQIVIADDGSIDGTQALLAGYGLAPAAPGPDRRSLADAPLAALASPAACRQGARAEPGDRPDGDRDPSDGGRGHLAAPRAPSPPCAKPLSPSRAWSPPPAC